MLHVFVVLIQELEYTLEFNFDIRLQNICIFLSFFLSLSVCLWHSQSLFCVVFNEYMPLYPSNDSEKRSTVLIQMFLLVAGFGVLLLLLFVLSFSHWVCCCQ